MFLIWKHLGLPPPTAVQYDIADYLQHGPKRKVIMAFRGIGKSWITAAFVLWLLYCDPQTKILVVSASKQRADDFSTFCQRLISEVPFLKHLVAKDEQRWSKIAFDVRPTKPDHAPSVKSAGITGQITGSRANHIVADDIEVANNSDTQTSRDKLSEQVKEFDAILKPGGSIHYLGTPQTEMSLYNNLPARGYEVRVWPARFPDAKRLESYGVKLAPFIWKLIEDELAVEGEAVDPARFDLSDLAQRELSYGRSGFALQFMLDTSLSDADRYPLRLRDLICMGLDPLKGPSDLIWASDVHNVLDVDTVGLEGDRFYGPMIAPKDYFEYTGSMMFVDPSGRGKDETAWAIVKMLLGRLYLVHMGASKGGYEDPVLEAILQDAKRFKVNLIQVEPNFGDGMFARALMAHRAKSEYNVSIEDAEWSKTQKESRIIDTLEPVMNQHRLVIDKAIIEWDYKSTLSYPPEEQNRYRLFYQMSRITKDRGSLANDDRLDALAGAVAYWLDQMSANTETAIKTNKDKILEAELKRHLEHLVGKKVSKRSYGQRSMKAMRKVW